MPVQGIAYTTICFAYRTPCMYGIVCKVPRSRATNSPIHMVGCPVLELMHHTCAASIARSGPALPIPGEVNFGRIACTLPVHVTCNHRRRSTVCIKLRVRWFCYCALASHCDYDVHRKTCAVVNSATRASACIHTYAHTHTRVRPHPRSPL